MLINSNAKKETGVPGTQSLGRGLGLLKLLANHQEAGLKLTEVIAASGLDRATAHRLLSSLVRERFVEKDPLTKQYRLGITSTQLGYASLRRMPMVDTCRPMMLRITRISGDTAFLMVRQEGHAFCLHRQAADFPVKVFTIDAGERRLLGIGAGGMAMLARLDDNEIAALHTKHAVAYRDNSYSMASLQAAVRRTRARGYAEVINTVTVGVTGVGAAIDVRDMLISVSFAAINSRMDARRREELGHLLVDELKQLGTVLTP